MIKVLNTALLLTVMGALSSCTAVSNATVSVATLPVKVVSAVLTETVKTGGNIVRQTVSSSGDIAQQAVDSGGDVAGQVMETAMDEGMKAVKNKAGTMIDDAMGLPDGTGKAALTIIDLIK